MRIIKKVCLIFLLYHLLALTMQSCCSRPDTFRITLNSLTKIESYWVTSDAGNSNLMTNQKVRMGDTLHFSTQLIDSTFITYAYSPQVSLISGAYAHQCEEDQYIASNYVSEIKIYTLRDFDEEHHGNDEVTEYFSLYHNARNYSFSELSNLDINNRSYQPSSSHLVFSLLKHPSADSLQQFLLAFTLSDGQVLQDTTAALQFEIGD